MLTKASTKIYLLLGLFPGIMLLTSCGFVYEKQVTGRYYIIGVDSDNDLCLSYDLMDGNYIGKAPPSLIEYGFNDTVIVAKCLEYNKTEPTYYLIDRSKDTELAHEENFRVGPISKSEYNASWKSKLKVEMKTVKDN